MKTTSILVLLSVVIIAWIIVVTVLFYEKPTKSENFGANSSVDNFTIFGERCSGTNFLQQAMEKNFDLKLTWKHGWKHEFGKHVDFSNSDKTLFLCIYRNPIDWINSLYRWKFHVSPELYELKDFLTKPMKMMKGKRQKGRNSKHKKYIHWKCLQKHFRTSNCEIKLSSLGHAEKCQACRGFFV